MKTTPEYKAIEEFYGNRTTKRSGVRLMNHIDEGLLILDQYHASENSKRAFCLHPLFQNNEELQTVGLEYVMSAKDPYPVMLVMEYRQWANMWLSDKVKSFHNRVSYECDTDPNPGPLIEVHQMLIADKVQNKKDFIRYHCGTHSRSPELSLYFDRWLDVLGVSNDRYVELCNHIERKTMYSE